MNDAVNNINNQNDKSNKTLEGLTNSKIFNASVYILSVLMLILGIILIVKINAVIKLSREYKDIAQNVQSDEYINNVLSEIYAFSEMYQLDNSTDYDTCKENAIAAYVYSMDDKYSNYKPPESYKQESNFDVGNGAGLGVKVSNNPDNGIYVDRVYAGSGAEKAGIKIGDYITKINDLDFFTDGYSVLIKSVRGKVNDTVKLTINRDGEDMEIIATLSKYNVSSLDLDLSYDDIAIVKIEEFSSEVANTFIKNMNDLKSKGYKNYIIDLRYNPGGHLESVVKMLDYLVPSGMIIEIKDKNGKVTYSYNSDKKEFDGNIVVLVNSGTASASELFAQTIKDFNKGKVVGITTFGKGTVLTEFELRNGGSVSLSTGLYTTNSGTFLEGTGVTPVYEVDLTEGQYKRYYELSDDEDTQLQKAIEVVRSM